MKRFALAVGLVLFAASWAAAQGEIEIPRLKDPLSWGVRIPSLDPAPEATQPGLPEFPAIAFGAGAGWWKDRESGNGSWFVELHAQVKLAAFAAIVGGIGLHYDSYDFLGSRLQVYEWPVEAGARLYPFPDIVFRPFAEADVVWAFVTVKYAGKSDTDNVFGLAVKAGAEIDLGESVFLDASIGWYFFTDPSSDTIDRKADFLKIGAGLNFRI